MMRLKVRLMRGVFTRFRTGRLWYQNVFVGGFMRRRLPWASSNFTGRMRHFLGSLRASLCLNTKSRAAPRDTEAMGQEGSSSRSSSLCSPMWSSPSLYLERAGTSARGKKKTTMRIPLLPTNNNHLFIRTKLKLWPVASVTASRMCSRVGVQTLAVRCAPEKEYTSPSSPYVACFRGTPYNFPNTCTFASSSPRQRDIYIYIYIT